MRILFTAAFLLAGLPCASHAAPDTLRAALKACQRISMPDQRLKCFDSTADTMIGPTMSQVPQDGDWEVKRSRSALDGSVIVAAHLQAATATMPWPSEEGPQYFVARCKEGKTEAYVYLGAWFGPALYPSNWPYPGYVRVSYAFDNELPVETKWHMSRDMKAYGLWAGGGTIPFLKRMAHAKKLTLRFAGSEVADIGFNLTGAETAIQAVREDCKW